jgi:hypothetical protein
VARALKVLLLIMLLVFVAWLWSVSQ